MTRRISPKHLNLGDIRGFAMGTVTSLTAVSRALTDIMIASLLQVQLLFFIGCCYIGSNCTKIHKICLILFINN